jgi:hypothetical protein
MVFEDTLIGGKDSKTSTGRCSALEVWYERRRGESVTVGTASVVVP